GDADRSTEKARTFDEERRGELLERGAYPLLAQTLIAVIIRQSEIGPAGMIDTGERRVGDDVQPLFAAIIGMGAPADIGEMAGRMAQPYVLRVFLQLQALGQPV